MSLKTALRWCHSFAQLDDCMTKVDSKSRKPCELFQGRKYHWKLVNDPSFTVAKKMVEMEFDVLCYAPTEEAETVMTIPADPAPYNSRSAAVK